MKIKTSLTTISLLLIIYNFCANLANDIYLPSMPKLVDVFATTTSALQWTMTAWFAGIAIPQLFFGPLTDRFGRTPILFGGGVCFLLATAACALSTNIWMLILARFFQGVGVSSFNVSNFAILVDLFEYKKRAKIMNNMTLYGMLAPLLGQVIGGIVLTLLGWRMNFIIIFIMSAIVMLGLWLTLNESNAYLNPQAMNVRHIYRSYRHLLFHKGFMRNLISYCLILGGLVAYLTAAPFIIIDQLQIAPRYFGYTQLPIFGIYILGAMYFGNKSNEGTMKSFIIKGLFIVFLASFSMLLLSYFFKNNLYIFIIPMSFYALGFSLSAGSLVNEVMSIATHSKGSAAAVLGFGMAMSCLMSSLLLGLIYNGSIWSVACLLFTLSALASCIYCIREPIDNWVEQTETREGS